MLCVLFEVVLTPGVAVWPILPHLWANDQPKWGYHLSKLDCHAVKWLQLKIHFQTNTPWCQKVPSPQDNRCSCFSYKEFVCGKVTLRCLYPHQMHTFQTTAFPSDPCKDSRRRYKYPFWGPFGGRNYCNIYPCVNSSFENYLLTISP